MGIIKKRKRRSSPREGLSSQSAEKVVSINRCTKVLKGGRKFSFSALAVAGNGNGTVGIGFAKANEVSDAVKKAGEAARKNVFSFELKGTTIPHEISGKWDGARVLLKPAPTGTGIIAGANVRAILEAGGIKDIVTKSLGSNNPMNVVWATLEALTELTNETDVLRIRGMDI